MVELNLSHAAEDRSVCVDGVNADCVYQTTMTVKHPSGQWGFMAGS